MTVWIELWPGKWLASSANLAGKAMSVTQVCSVAHVSLKAMDHCGFVLSYRRVASLMQRSSPRSR
eukprot:gene882-1163_t